jgi:hypothetical protein
VIGVEAIEEIAAAGPAARAAGAARAALAGIGRRFLAGEDVVVIGVEPGELVAQLLRDVGAPERRRRPLRRGRRLGESGNGGESGESRAGQSKSVHPEILPVETLPKAGPG